MTETKAEPERKLCFIFLCFRHKFCSLETLSVSGGRRYSYPCAHVGVCLSVSMSGTPRGLRDAGNCHFTALPEPRAREAPAG